jgi:2-polyprenyl-3-methyl-5-hydroxy-6-metoxy-1,4-benzoquinol methylase
MSSEWSGRKEKGKGGNMSKRITHHEEGITGTEKAEEYAKAHEKHGRLIYGPFLKEMKTLNMSGRCLEVGAGPGLFTSLFAEENPGVHITVTDISPDMVDLAKKRTADKRIRDRLDFGLCDVKDDQSVERLGRFDMVYSIYSLHHWDNPERCILNLLRAVKDGGLLYMGDLKRVWWLYYMPFISGDIQQIRASYRPGEIRGMLERHDIERVEIRTLFPFFLQSVIVRH